MLPIQFPSLCYSVRRPSATHVGSCSFKPHKSRCVATCFFHSAPLQTSPCSAGWACPSPIAGHAVAPRFPCARFFRVTSTGRAAGLQGAPPQPTPDAGALSVPPTPTGHRCPICYSLCPQMPRTPARQTPEWSRRHVIRGHVLRLRRAFSPQRGLGHSPSVQVQVHGGEPPSLGCRPPRLTEASSKPVLAPLPIPRPPPPLGSCVGKLLIDFTLVKNVNKLQMTS